MKKYLILSAAVLAFAACQNNDDAVIESNDLVPLQVSVANLDVTQSVVTRAVNSAWETGDEIGLFAVQTGTNTALAAQCNPSNMNYQFNDGSNYETAGPTSYRTFAANPTPVYLPANGAAIDVYAYYPWVTGKTVADHTHSISVATQTTQSAIDWMYTGKTDKMAHSGDGASKPITKNNVYSDGVQTACELLFTHALTKVQFNIVHGTGMAATDITGNTVSLSIAGMNTTATLDLFTGTVSGLGNVAPISPVQMGTAETGYDKSFEAIILPYTTVAAHAVTITIGSATYKFNIASGTAFAAANKYIYNVTVNAASLTVTAAITPWVTNSATAVTAQ